VRFALDFWRADDTATADARYFGLTPAQYGCVLVLAAGIVIATSLTMPSGTERA
jgi:hypothetical protein